MEKDKIYKVIKELPSGLPLGETITYDSFLKTCIHVDNQKRLSEIPYGFVLNHPEIFEPC